MKSVTRGMLTRVFFIMTIVLGILINAVAFPLPQGSSIALLQRIKKLNVLSRVLYIAAHPDDENNCLNAYLSKELLADVGYLSLTRGDGGQNLIGVEQQECLGVLRTQESLAAHSIDGARVFFTSARDFGFSKTAAEALQVWDREKVLSDIVWIIREFRPDIIITRFNPDVPEQHGQHVASAILAGEAFDAAADSKRFPEQLQRTSVWQTQCLLWNVYDQFSVKGSTGKVTNNNYLVVDAGKFSPLLGMSYGELAAQSRMLHRSQGMGTEIQRGSNLEYFKLVKGEKTGDNILNGVALSWAAKGFPDIEKAITQISDRFNIYQPEAIVPDLIELLRIFDKTPEVFWVVQKRKEVTAIIYDILGLHLQVNALEATLAPGEKTTVQIKLLNRSGVTTTLNKIVLGFAAKDTVLQLALEKCIPAQITAAVTVSNQQGFTQPYWLRQPADAGHYNLSDQAYLTDEIDGADNTFYISVLNYPLVFKVPLQYQYLSPEWGERYNSVAITPPVLLDATETLYCFSNNDAQTITITVRAGLDNVTGIVRPLVPQGWNISPAARSFTIEKKNAIVKVSFNVKPPERQEVGYLHAVAQVTGKTCDQGFRHISYGHITDQYYFPPAKAKLMKLDLRKTARRIAYLKGAADCVDLGLEQVGFSVTRISPQDITAANLKQFDAVVVGIRAYNIFNNLNDYNTVLLNYVKAGGNLVYQYNTNFDLTEPGITPLQITPSAKRVTDETAPITVLAANHRVLNYPNKITAADFKDWIQERGSYFPQIWNPQYQAIFAVADPGEEDLKGALLVARYGSGFISYTSLSFFRQLPAGVPGAYRLLSNIISLSDKKGTIGGR